MSSSTRFDGAATTVAPGPDCPEGFVPARIAQVVRETSDAVSLVLEIPDGPADRFRYRAGQFLTFDVQIDGQRHRRCYSMSSSPAADEPLRITVRRDGSGVVSNWLNSAVAPGDVLNVSPPEGRFVLTDTDAELVAFAGGSGITPIYSLIRCVLATSERRVRLLYANRTREAAIFGDALRQLAAAEPDRLTLHQHFDDTSGRITPSAIRSFLAAVGQAEYYICGPAPFMARAEDVVRASGVAAERVHVERFTLAAAPGAEDTADAATTDEVTIVLNGRSTTVPYRAGATVLQTARTAGLRAPSSCEVGSCGTCMARVVEGSVRMLNNEALDDDEVADGWIVTCQSLPTSPTLRVSYE